MKPLREQVNGLGNDLREKSASLDRMRNDFKHSEKRLEVALKALHKIENHNQLKGAAHLIIPTDKTKLPKTVLPCIECFERNVPCDAQSHCQNCELICSDVIKSEALTQHQGQLAGQACHRWRCSQMHILRSECRVFECPLEHDANGWLMLKGPQPQW